MIAVDTSMDPYENLKTALYEGRFTLEDALALTKPESA